MQSRTTLARRRRQTFALASIGVVAGVGGVSAAATLAAFDAQPALAGSDLPAGTVTLATGRTSVLVSFSGLAPGRPVTQRLTISGAGPLDRVYSATTSGVISDMPLGPVLLTIRSGVTTCSNAGFATDGSLIYAGVVGPAPLAAPARLFGEAEADGDATSRSLPAGSTEPLCFQASVPEGTNGATQGSGVSIGFTFDSETAAAVR